MTKLNPDTQFPISDAAVASILTLYNIFDFTYSKITQGIANTTLLITAPSTRYVLRLYAQGRKTDEEIYFELSFQEYLRDNGIPIPLVLSNMREDQLSHVILENTTWQAILMEHVPGSSKTTEHTETLLRELATYQATMHLLGSSFSNPNTQGKPWDSLVDFYASSITDRTRYSDETTGFIERAQAYVCQLSSELPRGYNHLDLDLDGNVIVDQGHVRAIIDFDDVEYSPIVVCIGFSLWNILCDENFEKVKDYLNFYEKVRPLQNLEREALRNILMYRNYKIGLVRLLKSNSDEVQSRILEMEKEIPSLEI